MSLDRRKVVGLFAASAATALAGCGGGGDDGGAPLTRFVWLLNLNPEYRSADFSIGATPVASALPAPGLTEPAQVEFGRYTFRLRERTTGATQSFDRVPIDDLSPSMFVFYRRFDSSRLDASPPGIINYFDSSTSLDVDLFDDAGGVQRERLAFESSASQVARSRTCTLRLYPAGSPTLVYDSGPQQRTDSILIYPRFPAASPSSGQVAVVGLNYSADRAGAVVWPNLLG